jgi:VCBS repeat-containing protein
MFWNLFKRSSNRRWTARKPGLARRPWLTVEWLEKRELLTTSYGGGGTSSPPPTAPPPMANNDSYSVLHDRTLKVSTPGVLSNDGSPTGRVLTAVLQSSPQHGTLSFASNGTFSYTAAAGFTGADSFTYKDSDGTATSNLATVGLTVTNQAPVVGNPGARMGKAGDPVSFQLSAGDADGDSLTFSATGLPTGVSINSTTGLISGTISSQAGKTNTVTVTASDGLATGSASFAWTVVALPEILATL